MQSAQIKAQADVACKQRKETLQVDLDHNAEVLEAKLDRARARNQALQDENERLQDELKALRLKSAAAQARMKEAAAEAKAKNTAGQAKAKDDAKEAQAKAAEAKAEAAAEEAAAQARTKAEEAKAKAAEAKKAATEAKAAKTKAKAAQAKVKAAGQKAHLKVEAAAPATTKNVADPNFNGTTNQEATEDDVVDQELEAADSADRGVPEQSVTESKVQKAMDAATEAQEEVDRAWAAEKRHRNEADSKAAELSKEAAPHTISAHKLPPESHDHRTRVDDVDRAVAEELEHRHNNHISQEFTKMTVDTIEAQKSKAKSKAGKTLPPGHGSAKDNSEDELDEQLSWAERAKLASLKGKAKGFAAHPQFRGKAKLAE